MLIHHLICIWTGSVDCSDHLGWIRTGSGGYGDRTKQTNVSVDVNLLTTLCPQMQVDLMQCCYRHIQISYLVIVLCFWPFFKLK